MQWRQINDATYYTEVDGVTCRATFRSDRSPRWWVAALALAMNRAERMALEKRAVADWCTQPMISSYRSAASRAAETDVVDHSLPSVRNGEPVATRTAVSIESIGRRTEAPVMSGIFWIIAVLQMVCGVVLCAQLWPGEPEAGYHWKAITYVPSLTWLTAGFISGFLFIAIGQALLYLRDIRDGVWAQERHLRAAREGASAHQAMA